MLVLLSLIVYNWDFEFKRVWISWVKDFCMLHLICMCSNKINGNNHAFFFFFNISYYCGLLNFFQRFHVCDNSLNPNKINGSKHPIFDRRMFSQLTLDFFFFLIKKIILLQNQALFNFCFLLWLFLNNMRLFFFFWIIWDFIVQKWGKLHSAIGLSRL